MLDVSQRQEGVSPSQVLTRPRERGADPVPPRLAPALTMAGGLLMAIGGIGTWVRATNLPLGGTQPVETAVETGRSGAGGWILLGIGLLVAASGVAWLARRPHLRALPAAGSLVAIVLVSIRLVLIDRRAAEMATGADQAQGIAELHSGFGWGAWLLVIAVVLLALGLLTGALRELDLRRHR